MVPVVLHFIWSLKNISFRFDKMKDAKHDRIGSLILNKFSTFKILHITVLYKGKILFKIISAYKLKTYKITMKKYIQVK